MATPFVSVLIDTYNHERFIEEALASVLAQDYPIEAREIIVVDDGSTDRTPEILRRFESQAKIMRKPNGGQASAFNYGIPACKGEIVAFLDGDDWWAPNKLAAVVQAFSGNPDIGLVGNGIYEMFGNGEQFSHTLREGYRFRADSLEGAGVFRQRKAFLGTSRMAYRLPLLRKIGPVPEFLRVQADEYLFTLAAVLCDVLILAEPLTFYRIHENNGFQISAGNAELQRRKYRLLAELAATFRNKLPELGLSPEVRRAIVEVVQNESDMTRLAVDGGFPWETISAELLYYRAVHPGASAAQRLFKLAALLPAAVVPPRAYYALRQSVASQTLFRGLRARLLPSPKPAHIAREGNGDKINE